MKAEELIQRARDLAPKLLENARDTETQRRISDEAMKDLQAAGLFGVVQQERYGGLELGLDAFVRVVQEIARACGSTGWVYSVVAMHQWLVGLFPPQAQEDVWGEDIHALASSSFPPMGTVAPSDGGFRLTGKWIFASGCDNTSWSIIGGRAPLNGREDPLKQCFFLVPRSDYEIDDYWHVVGLAGTGSKNLVLEDVFVPAHRMLVIEEAGAGRAPGAQINQGPLFRVPFFTGITTSICSPVLGMAQGALDHSLRMMDTRATKGAFTPGVGKVAEYQTIQLRVAEAAASVDAACLLLMRLAEDTMAAAESPEGPSQELRVRNRRDQAFAVRLLVQGVDRLFESTGANGLFLADDVQRSWRDVRSAAQHITNNWDAAGTLYGRFVLGLDTGGTPY